MLGVRSLPGNKEAPMFCLSSSWEVAGHPLIGRSSRRQCGSRGGGVAMDKGQYNSFNDLPG